MNPKNSNDEKIPILVVDDEQHVLTAIKRSLRKQPWIVLTATSGDEGLNILEQMPVQVTISDYLMKEMDGVEFLNRVKDRWPDVQRVMLTGQANPEAIERAINESEVYRFLNKPWNDSHLVVTIQECIGRLDLIISNRRYRAELAQRNQELTNINRDLEKKVQERTRALLQAEKMAALGRMSSGVAHEINNPLSGILAFVQLLLRDAPKTDPQTQEGLETIQMCGLRCKRIVDNLLSFSRKSAGEGHMLLDLNQVIENGLTISRFHPKAKKVPVNKELDPNLPKIIGQAGLLEQLVVNLLQNAYQASLSNQEISIRTKVVDGDVWLEVQDQGQGIPEDVIPRIFEPFFTTKEPGEGTGLGLFISYGIAQEHGGNLCVESMIGQGAKFILKLPAELKTTGKEQSA